MSVFHSEPSPASRERVNYIIGAIWFTLTATLLLTCSIPKEIDFERYMAISRHVFEQREYLLLYFNQALYTDKPPLMFWMIAAGWHLFGVNNLWPYALLALFSGGSVILTTLIGKILFQCGTSSLRNGMVERAVLSRHCEEHERRSNPDWSLSSVLNWVASPMARNDDIGGACIPKLLGYRSALFLLLLTYFGMASCELRVDTFLVFFSLLIHYGCLALSCANTRRLRYCLMVTTGTALGLLSKGPLIFVTGFLPALLGLYAIKQKPVYKLIFISTLLGFIPVLSWLVPACMAGGEAYARDVLFGQVAKRSVLHDNSAWYYLIRVPGFLFPFSLLPSVWRSLYRSFLSWKSAHPAVRYTLTGILVQGVIFSFFGQKSIHYLQPVMPLLAIFLAGAAEWNKEDCRGVKIGLTVFIVFCGLLWFLRSGTGLLWLKSLTHYSYGLYLFTQSFRDWQIILLLIFGILGLSLLFWRPRKLLLVTALLSLVLQINIQIFYQYYFESRFYRYFQSTVEVLLREEGHIEMLFSDKENLPDCSKMLSPTILENSSSSRETKNIARADYIISNNRCLLFSQSQPELVPQFVFVPSITCAFGLWKNSDILVSALRACEG